MYASVGTRLLLRFTNLLDGLKNIEMSWDRCAVRVASTNHQHCAQLTPNGLLSHRWLRNIVPIGALFSASLIFSNLAYLSLRYAPEHGHQHVCELTQHFAYLSISFIQMYVAGVCGQGATRWLMRRGVSSGSRRSRPSQVSIRHTARGCTSLLTTTSPIAVLSMSVLMGLEKFNQRTATIVCAISFGVALASYGEVDLCVLRFGACLLSRVADSVVLQRSRWSKSH